MPKGIRLTEAEQARRRREIVDASVALFLKHGFPETSMRAIAEAAGMGKSSLYDYFPTKDDILLFIIEQISGTITEQVRAIAARDLPPEQRLAQIMAAELSYLQANDSLLWLLSNQAQRLKPESQQLMQQRRYVFQDLVRAVIDEGVASGRFRPVDTLLAARLLINSIVSVLYTSRPTGSAEVMLDEAVAIILRGLMRSELAGG